MDEYFGSISTLLLYVYIVFFSCLLQPVIFQEIRAERFNSFTIFWALWGKLLKWIKDVGWISIE